MQVLFPAAAIVLVPVHCLLAGKSCILMRAKTNQLFLARNTMFYLPHTPLILPQLIYFPVLILLFFLIFIHDHIYRTWTPPRPYMDPTLTLPPPFFSTTTFLLLSLHHHHHHHHHRHLSIVFPPPLVWAVCPQARGRIPDQNDRLSWSGREEAPQAKKKDV